MTISPTIEPEFALKKIINSGRREPEAAVWFDPGGGGSQPPAQRPVKRGDVEDFGGAGGGSGVSGISGERARVVSVLLGAAFRLESDSKG